MSLNQSHLGRVGTENSKKDEEKENDGYVYSRLLSALSKSDVHFRPHVFAWLSVHLSVRPVGHLSSS